VTIVGQQVGDRLRFWGEGGTMTLPNSGITLRFATGLHDYTRSCLGERGCYWIMRLFPMHLRTLAPEVIVPYTYADYRALRDPVLDYVLQVSATTELGVMPQSVPQRASNGSGPPRSN
jgi:hypothetical protein